MNNSHKTAITRSTLSRPMQHLKDKGLLRGIMLDYGCGKGYDAQELYMDMFDPHYTDGIILCQHTTNTGADVINTYDTITCNYVLNVIEDEDEMHGVIDHIHRMLSPEGIAYITVRRDVKEAGHTSKGTYQHNVVIDLPVLRELKGQYCIYIMDKGGYITD